MSINKRRASLVSEAKNWQWSRDLQIKKLKEKFHLKQEDYLLDFGCGVLRGGIPIIEYLKTGHYYGIEVDQIRLQEGKKELEENNLQDKKPVLGTNFSIMDRKMDLILSWQVFIHLKDEILKESLASMVKFLKHDGKIISTVHLSEEVIEDGKWREYPVVFRSFEFYKGIADDQNLNVEISDSTSKKEHKHKNTTLVWTKKGVNKSHAIH